MSAAKDKTPLEAPAATRPPGSAPPMDGRTDGPPRGGAMAATGKPTETEGSDGEGRASRRGMLRGALGVVAAVAGAGALIDTQAGTAEAASGSFDSNVAGTPAIAATGTTGANGLEATSDSGVAIIANSSQGSAIVAKTNGGSGHDVINAQGFNGADGLDVSSDSGYGITASSASGTAISARSNTSTAIDALSISGDAISAVSKGSGFGVHAKSAHKGVWGESSHGTGVEGDSDDGVGVWGGVNASGTAVRGDATFGGKGAGVGVYGISDTGLGGIFASGLATSYTGSHKNTGVVGISSDGAGVEGISDSGIGVHATSSGVALQVDGPVHVSGASVGQVTMGTHVKTLTVPTAAATTNSNVILTPLQDPHARLWISARADGRFTIEASAALQVPVDIQYLIIN